MYLCQIRTRFDSKLTELNWFNSWLINWLALQHLMNEISWTVDQCKFLDCTAMIHVCWIWFAVKIVVRLTDLTLWFRRWISCVWLVDWLDDWVNLFENDLLMKHSSQSWNTTFELYLKLVRSLTVLVVGSLSQLIISWTELIWVGQN